MNRYVCHTKTIMILFLCELTVKMRDSKSEESGPSNDEENICLISRSD